MRHPNAGTSKSVWLTSSNLSPKLSLLCPQGSIPDHAHSIAASGLRASMLSFLWVSPPFLPTLLHYPAHRSLTAPSCLLSKLCSVLHSPYTTKPQPAFLFSISLQTAMYQPHQYSHHSPACSPHHLLMLQSENRNHTRYSNTENLLKEMVKRVF